MAKSKNVVIIPAEYSNASRLIADFFSLTSFAIEKAFIEIMGKTQGIKFNIIPPINAPNKALMKDKLVGFFLRSFFSFSFNLLVSRSITSLFGIPLIL